MAINTATIQHRRGRLEDFNPEKLMPGEIAVITDERSVYMGFPGGEAEKIVLEKDFTSESIKDKLGYEPADEERVDQLFRDKADYQYVDEKVSNVKVDLTGYAKEDYVDAEIEELNKKIVQETGKLSQEKVDQKELENYVLKDEIPTVPVQSVNGKTGAVQLSASEVGALPNSTKIPANTSDLTNNSGFITKTVTDLANYYLKTEVYTQEEIDNKLSAIPKFAIEVVSTLPTANISETTVYLIASGNEEHNLYTEYIYVDGQWEYLGKQTVDLTNYVKRAELSNYYLKSEMDSLLTTIRNSIPTQLSQFTEDSTHRTVTDTEKKTWNAKSNFSGAYGDLTGKPTIPTKTSQLTNDSNFVDKSVTDKLSQEIDDYQSQLDGKQPIGNYLTEVPSEYVTEDELETKINDLKVQNEQKELLYAQGNTVEEVIDWLELNGDKTKLYVGADEAEPEKGWFYAYKLTEKEVASGGYTNRLPLATETYNGSTIYGDGKGYLTGIRLSSSGSVSTSDNMIATGFICEKDANGNPITLDGARIRTEGFEVTDSPMKTYVISYNASGTKINHYSWTGSYIRDFTLDSATYGTGIAFIRISTSTLGSSPSIVTVNEEIKAGSTTVVKEYAWENTGFALVPADYEERIIALEREVAELESGSKVKNLVGISEVFAPSPQLPANDSQESDLNILADVITAEQIYGFIDSLLNLYPRFITKEVMGKDASGTHDWCRYICSRRAYDAWQKPNYPSMYAWTNGSTTIYSVSVSPRIGDTLYTTKYIGTSKGNVTAVSNANQTRTVGGVAYKRDKTKDVEPTLFYTETSYSPYFSSNYANAKKGVYDENKTKISTISNMSNGTLTDASGNTYKRYPLGDRNSKFKEIPAIVIGANEHGTGGDPATPAMISARIAKDLCECKQMDNPFLNLLKNDYMVVFCPVVNPWGLNYNNKSYFNANGVNLDRNFDTIGWMTTEQEPAGWNTGAYGGSENETQYFMNTLVASKCKVAMCNHSYGQGIDSTTGEAVSGGICSYMMGRNKTKYAESLLKIAEVMACNYNLVFTDNGEAPPENWAKTRSYFESIGVDGVALEINSRDGFITDPNNEAQGKQFTGRVMEAGYTQLLQVLYMMIDKQE